MHKHELIRSPGFSEWQANEHQTVTHYHYLLSIIEGDDPKGDTYSWKSLIRPIPHGPTDGLVEKPKGPKNGQ